MILIFDFDECAATVLNVMPKLITVNKHYAEWHYDGYRNFIIHHYAFRNGINVDSSMTCAYRTESNRIFMLKASTISSPISMHKGKSSKKEIRHIYSRSMSPCVSHPLSFLGVSICVPMTFEFLKCKHPVDTIPSISRNSSGTSDIRTLHVTAIYTVSFPLFDFRWVFRFYRRGVYE